MDTKALRQKVLDLAIRGKLVPQDPNDEPASVLLERIRQQKKQMVRDGKLKPKDIKNDTIIFVGEDNLHYEKFADGSVKCIEDEIPFDLPEGWEWERLSNLAYFSGGKTPSTSHGEYWDGDTLWVTSKDMKSKYITSSQLRLSSLGAEQMQMYPPNTLLLVTRSGILRHTLPVAILKECATINQDLKAIVLYMPQLVEYIYMCLKGMETQLLLKYTKSGTTVENVNFDEFQKVLLPIPPVEQINKIVSSTGRAECVVTTIEDNKTALADYVVKAKSKILDFAIRGQLVPQDPNDEPASVLLERIRTEKEKLIRQGRIKRDKKESVIFRGEDNSYYFDIPDGWALCPLKELFNVCSAKRVRQSDWRTEGVPFYRAREIVKLSDNGFVDNDLFISEEHYIRVKAECGVPEPGDLMVSGVGTIGKVYVVNSDDRFYYKDASVLCFENRTGVIDSQFARYMLESEFMQAQMKDNSKGTTVDTITISAAMEYVCVLPPLAEQKRIVSAIETAFVHLKSISDALT